MPNTDICAKCKTQGDPIKLGPLRIGGIGAYEWECPTCGFT